MCKYIFIFLALFYMVSGNSQTTIGASSMIAVGDTLFTGVHTHELDIDLDDSGGGLYWDLSDARISYYNIKEFEPVPQTDQSSSFLDANMFVATGIRGGIYYRSENGTLRELGRTTLDPFGNNVLLHFRNKGAAIYKKLPVSYGDRSTERYSYETQFSGKLIPRSLLMGSFIAPDSVRIIVEVLHNTEIDAWGTLALPNDNYEVLREKSSYVYNTITEIKTFQGWIEVDPSVLGPLSDVFMPKTVDSYRFYADGEKETLAEVILDFDGNPSRIEIKAKDLTSRAIVLRPDESKVFVHPNPSYGNVNFEFVNLNKGNYNIQVSNILGKTLYNNKFWIDHNARLTQDLTFLSKGTYIYTVTNELGKRITTKRLVIITP